MAAAHILVVDDEPDIRTLLKEILEDEGYAVDVAENGEQAREMRRSQRPDLILLDIWMPGIDGISLLKEWNEEENVGGSVIMMSGHGTVETAVEATRLGAWDFIEKPLSLAKLLVTVQRALEANHLQRENVGLRKQVIATDEPVGKSGAIQEAIAQVKRVALHDTPVFIAGEPGTGKGLFARYLHASSPRRDGPFIDVGVASLQGDNPAAELFGHEEDGHLHYGLLEQANGGTLFLDDIADMDDATQARLLGALESGQFHRIGGHESVSLDARVVAGSQHDLLQRINDGKFRSDLFYQLNVVPLTLPPLREHPEDIPELVNFYVDQFVAHEKLPYRAFSVAAQNRLRHYAWPGNVRELKNLVQRLLIIGRDSEVDADEIDSVIGDSNSAQSAAVGVAFQLPLRQAREQFERSYFEHLLREFGGNINQTAQHAGVERTHLYRKLRTLGIDPKQLDNG